MLPFYTEIEGEYYITSLHTTDTVVELSNTKPSSTGKLMGTFSPATQLKLFYKTV
jgi:hypothetical protein